MCDELCYEKTLRIAQNDKKYLSVLRENVENKNFAGVKKNERKRNARKNKCHEIY